MTEIEKQEVINELLRQRKQFLGPQGCCVKSETRNRFTARCFSAAITSICKVSEYEKAESEGLLVVLPCKDGDKIYNTASFFSALKEPEEHIVEGFTFLHGEMTILCKDGYRTFGNKIGKTVFLTRAEAEAALSGWDGADD